MKNHITTAKYIYSFRWATSQSGSYLVFIESNDDDYRKAASEINVNDFSYMQHRNLTDAIRYWSTCGERGFSELTEEKIVVTKDYRNHRFAMVINKKPCEKCK